MKQATPLLVKYLCWHITLCVLIRSPIPPCMTAYERYYVHVMFSFSKSPRNPSRVAVPVAERRVPLPVFPSRVPAGFPSPAEDFADGVLDLNDLIEHPAATFVIRVSGYSMSGAGIFDNDLLIVDRSIKPRSGQVVVAVVEGEMVVKRLRRKKGVWWLVPEAPEHAEFEAAPMGEGSEIWGVVKTVIRPLA